MARVATFTCDDPIPYQASFRGAAVDFSISGKGRFSGELLQIDLNQVWMQQGRENLPRVVHAQMDKQRVGVAFNAEPNQFPGYYSGMQLDSNAIFVLEPGASGHSRTSKPHNWAAMSLPTENLSAASRALVGHEPTNRPVTRLVHPDPAQMVRLVRLHAAVRGLAVASPETLVHPEVATALEHQLVHALVSCLGDEVPAKAGSGWRYHSAIIDRFEEVLAASCDRPMYLADICSAVGASERTLRACCEERLGMGPIRYLWLRRMHLARRTLLGADPARATVTRIATDHGFWELGRFSVAYQVLFGESPSASLRKPSSAVQANRARPLSLAGSDFA
jgi:AraC-like DNA-binding protein